MKKILIFLGVVLMFSGTALGKIEVPGRTDRAVNDYAGIIDKDSAQYIEGLAGLVQQKTPDRAEIIVATFRSLEDWQTGDFVREYGEKWRKTKPGSRDNGVILLVIMDRKKAVIGTGQNLKGILTDEIVGDILDNTITPEFKNGRYSEGIKKAVRAIVKILNDSKIPKDNPVFKLENLTIILLVIVGFALLKKWCTLP